MNLIQAILLGLVQGITEFFPVSSSAHLKFTRFLLSLPDGEHWTYFDLTCHAGTWLALCFYLRKEIWATLTSFRQIALFSVALAPLVPAYFLLKPIRLALSEPHYTGYFLLVTALLLFLARKKSETLSPKETEPQRKESSTECPVVASNSRFLILPIVPAFRRFSLSCSSPTLKFTHVLSIGIMQSFALLPGLSRSGSTIAAGRFCGLSWTDAARFSFLLAVPTIFGGEALESIKALKSPPPLPMSLYLTAFTTSFIVGIGSVRAVFWCYEKEMVKPFIWYCIAFGLLLLGVYREEMKDRQIGQESSLDFLGGARGSAREHDASEHEKDKAKLTQVRSDSSFTSGIYG